MNIITQSAHTQTHSSLASLGIHETSRSYQVGGRGGAGGAGGVGGAEGGRGGGGGREKKQRGGGKGRGEESRVDREGQPRTWSTCLLKQLNY